MLCQNEVSDVMGGKKMAAVRKTSKEKCKRTVKKHWDSVIHYCRFQQGSSTEKYKRLKESVEQRLVLFLTG